MFCVIFIFNVTGPDTQCYWHVHMQAETSSVSSAGGNSSSNLSSLDSDTPAKPTKGKGQL